MATANRIKFSELFKSFTNRITYVFSIIVFAFAIIGVIVGKNTVAVSALPCGMLMWTALFSLLISITGLICDLLKNIKLNSVILYSIHFVLSYASFLAVFVYGKGASAYLEETAMTNFAFKIIVMTLIFIIIYVAVWVIRLIASGIAKRIENKNKEYESVYTDK